MTSLLRALSSSRSLAALAILGLLLPACGPHRISGTTIEDTPDSHAILGVLERYRSAVENKDVGTLVGLLSSGFHDSGGSDNPEDVLDLKNVRQKLTERLSQAQEIHLDLDVRSIHVEQDQASAVFYYTERFMMPKLTSRPQNESDLKQMLLRNENGQWKILSGI